MNCSNCQNPIQQGEKFCGKCGKETSTELSRGLMIFWKILLALDVISALLVPIAVLVLSITGTIFNDAGVEHPVRSFFILGMLLACVNLVLCIVGFKLFSRRKVKIGILVALIGASPILYQLYNKTIAHYFQSKRRVEIRIKQDAWIDCIKIKKSSGSSGDNEKIIKSCEDETGYVPGLK